MRRTNLSSASNLGSVVEFDEVYDASGRATAFPHRASSGRGPPGSTRASPRAYRPNEDGEIPQAWLSERRAGSSAVRPGDFEASRAERCGPLRGGAGVAGTVIGCCWIRTAAWHQETYHEVDLASRTAVGW